MTELSREKLLAAKSDREQLELKAHWALCDLSDFYYKHHDPLFYKVNALIRDLGTIRGAERSYQCPYCRAVSYHPDDIKNQYCGACHRFADGSS